MHASAPTREAPGISTYFAKELFAGEDLSFAASDPGEMVIKLKIARISMRNRGMRRPLWDTERPLKSVDDYLTLNTVRKTQLSRTVVH